MIYANMSKAQVIDHPKLEIDFLDSYLKAPITKKAVIFSISISITKSGIIDSIFYSSTEQKRINEIVNLKNIDKSIWNQKSKFSPYPNALVIIPVMIINLSEGYIGNQEALLREWSDLFPIVQKFKKKRTFITKPISIAMTFDSH